MDGINKIIALMGLAKLVVKPTSYQHAFGRIGIVIFLSAASGLLAGFLVACWLFAAYNALLVQGLSIGMALLTISFITIAIIAAIVLMIWTQFHKLQTSFSSPIESIVHAFVKGLKGD